MTVSHRRPFAAAVAGVAAAFSLMFTASCGTDGGSDDATDDGGAVKVFAAASLENSGEELADAFAEEVDDSASIEYNFAGSSKLVQQIGQGADADLFISADEENMDAARELPEFGDAAPSVIATNTLVLVVAPDSGLDITSVSDLDGVADAGIALCADGVPCGTLAHRVLDDNGVDLDSWTVSEEANVSDVATRISTGEVSAGFVYATDALAMRANEPERDYTVVDLDVEPNAYPAALTDDGRQDPGARAFLRWLTSDRAQRILEKHGFGPA